MTRLGGDDIFRHMFNRSYIFGHEDHPHYLSNRKINELKQTLTFSGQDEEMVRVIKNLSDPTKFRIYQLLHWVDEIAVTDVALILDLSQSTVSHALADLKNLGLVTSQRCGQLICYSLPENQSTNILQEFINRFNTRGRPHE